MTIIVYIIMVENLEKKTWTAATIGNIFGNVTVKTIIKFNFS